MIYVLLFVTGFLLMFVYIKIKKINHLKKIYEFNKKIDMYKSNNLKKSNINIKVDRNIYRPKNKKRIII